MAFTENGGNDMVMPVAPMNYGGGWGNGFGGDGWWVILFLFALMGNGFGGFGGGFGGLGLDSYLFNTQTQNDVNRGFDNAGIASQLTGIQGAVTNGFSSAEVANCNRAMDAMQTAYNNQIASMNQNFANQQALDARLGSMEMAQQNCCCENRAAVADLKYTVATEACADRAAVNDALRDVIAATQAQTQTILDKLCQQEIDTLKTQNSNLQTQLNMANLRASQNAQTAAILANNEAQTTALEQYLAPVPHPNCCGGYGYGGCGCAA